jgi:hypothetical protein
MFSITSVTPQASARATAGLPAGRGHGRSCARRAEAMLPARGSFPKLNQSQVVKGEWTTICDAPRAAAASTAVTKRRDTMGRYLGIGHVEGHVDEGPVDAQPSLEPVEMAFGLGHHGLPVAQENLGAQEILHFEVALIGDQPVAVVGRSATIRAAPIFRGSIKTPAFRRARRPAPRVDRRPDARRPDRRADLLRSGRGRTGRSCGRAHR